ncbi:MAG TPA: cupin domain-containing protein [Acidimicrobiales bacterium]|nr:cupin domain-containing protein [Acidimicrobiales bacterium]
MTDVHDHASVSTPAFEDAANRQDLEDWGPLEEATGAEMQTSGLTLWQGDGGAETGIWECTPGPSRWKLETNELVHVLKGSMTVTADGGEPTEVGAGDVVMFPTGWEGTWDIHETLRKVYAIF